MDTSPEILYQVLGRLHPILVHFPIALLILAGLLEVFRRREKPTDSALICLVVGSLGAAAAAWSGWEFFEHDGPGESRTMFLHRWGGVTVAGLALVCVVLGLVARSGTRPRIMPFFRGGVLLNTVLVAFVAHQGGSSVWGDGFVLEVLDQKPSTDEVTAQAAEDELVDSLEVPVTIPLVPLLPPAAVEPDAVEPNGTPTEAPAAVAASTGVDYTTQIQPILEASCYDCHGPKKRPKAGLRLSDMPDVFAGAQEDWIIRPGDADGSLLYQRITLPTDHEDYMPAKGDPLTEEQVRLLREWIDQGAAWTAAVVVDGEPETAAYESEEELPVVVFPEPLELDEAARATRDVALEVLRESGAHAGRIALDTDEVEVNLGLLAERADDDSLALLRGLEPCLVSLDLSRSAVTDAGLTRLRTFTRLRRLRLDHTAVGDEGVSRLVPHAALEYLNLVGTTVSDAGLASLAELPALRKVFLWQTPVTDAGAEGLAVKRPRLEIVRDTYTPVVVEADAEAKISSLSAACCDAARAAGKDCDHPCCVEAAAKGEVCPQCSA